MTENLQPNLVTNNSRCLSQPNLIFPKPNDEIIPIEISFTDKKGIKDKKFRDEVIDDIYDMLFKSLKMTSFGMAFKNNTEVISFNLIKGEEDNTVFTFIYEKLMLLKETEPNFRFKISGTMKNIKL